MTEPVRQPEGQMCFSHPRVMHMAPVASAAEGASSLVLAPHSSSGARPGLVLRVLGRLVSPSGKLLQYFDSAKQTDTPPNYVSHTWDFRNHLPRGLQIL